MKQKQKTRRKRCMIRGSDDSSQTLFSSLRESFAAVLYCAQIYEIYNMMRPRYKQLQLNTKETHKFHLPKVQEVHPGTARHCVRLICSFYSLALVLFPLFLNYLNFSQFYNFTLSSWILCVYF